SFMQYLIILICHHLRRSNAKGLRQIAIREVGPYPRDSLAQLSSTALTLQTLRHAEHHLPLCVVPDEALRLPYLTPPAQSICRRRFHDHHKGRITGKYFTCGRDCRFDRDGHCAASRCRGGRELASDSPSVRGGDH